MENPAPVTSQPKQARHFPALDGLRAVAVILVILLHLSYGYFPGGFVGVDMFFVLSGYLITGLLAEEYTTSGKIRFDLFYLRRFYRLSPAIFLCLILCLILWRFVPWNLNYAWSVILSIANFVPKEQLGMLSPTWSLSVEEQFYLLWPISLLVLLRQKNRLVFRIGVPALLAIGSQQLAAYLVHHGFEEAFVYRFTLTHMDGLFVGAIAALIGTGPKVQQAAHFCSRFRFPEVVILAAILYGVNALPYGDFLMAHFKAPLFAVLILCAVYQKQAAIYHSILTWHWAIWLGKRSYGLYLYHVPILFALESFRVKHSLVNFAVITLFRITLPIVMADLSYRYIEMPFLRRKAGLRWNTRGIPPATDAPVLGAANS